MTYINDTLKREQVCFKYKTKTYSVKTSHSVVYKCPVNQKNQ